MPPKKRKVSLSQSSEASKDDLTPKRRKKLVQYDPSEICSELFETIRNHKDDSGRLLCEAFIRIPKRSRGPKKRSEPEYYDLVEKPIDMLKIQHKLKNDEYEDIDALSEDVQLMITNAKLYYARNSTEYQDACELWELFEETKGVLLTGVFGQPGSVAASDDTTNQEMPAQESVDESELAANPETGSLEAFGEDSQYDQQMKDENSRAVHGMSMRGRKPDFVSLSGTVHRPRRQSHESIATDDASIKDDGASSIADDESALYEELFTAVVTAADDSGARMLSDIFKLLPPRNKFPHYYEIIKEPIDLKTIAMKIQQNAYTSLNELYQEMLLMINNAKIFNEPGSQIYKDAIALKKIVSQKKFELDQPKVPRPGRPRKRPAPTQKLSATIASLEYDDGDSNQGMILPPPNPILMSPASQSASSNIPMSLHRSSSDEDQPIEYLAIKPVRTPQGTKIYQCEFCHYNTNRRGNLARHIGTVHRKDRVGPPRSPYVREQARWEKNREMVQNTPPNTRQFQSVQSLHKEPITIHIDKEELDEEQYEESNYEEFGESAASWSMSSQSAVQRTVAAAAQDVDDTTMDVSGITMEEETSILETDASTDPLWILYHSVKNYKDNTGVRLSEPFIRLPDKRIYPDYYEEIRKPMSFLKIQKKIKVGRYKTLEMLASDMELMFRNAMQYNIEDSKIYKDAVRLTQVMHAKKKEMLTGERALPSPSVPIPNLTTLSKSFEPLLNGVYSNGLSHTEVQISYEVASTPVPVSDFLTNELLESEFSVSPALVTKFPRRPDGSEERKKPGRKPLAPEDLAKKRALGLWNALMEYQVDGRNLIEIFVQLPSKKDYPDYYMVISDPIDMTMIKQNIDNELYTTEQAIVQDFSKMFNNARIYNEEGSQVFMDANTLERVLKNKVRNFGQVNVVDPLSPKMNSGRGGNRRATQYASPLDQKLHDLYNAIKDHADPRGRMLSTPFIKLPSKQEYPDYYEVIRKPIDMAIIHQRIIASKYTCLEDMVADFVLMFDNACKYNEPESLIYKDALTLQRVCLEKKQDLGVDDDDLPDIKSLVQELMLNLFISTFNATDEEGRCYSDSFIDMPSPQKEELIDPANPDISKPPLTFDQLKRNLDMGRYRRLDRFQEDMFELFEYARRVSRSDSQLYEDAVELQLFFIKKRDELCKKGEVMVSPALSYMEGHLTQSVDVEKKEKILREAEEAKENEVTKDDCDSEEDSFEYKGLTFTIGDFVYIEPREAACDPHIVSIEKLWRESDGEMWLRGNWFLRPNETFHNIKRKFLQKEVFKSDFCDSVPFTKVLGKCFVMSVKEYFKMRPDGFSDEDVFVCESRYSGRLKAFKKIKIWPCPKNENVKIIAREQPLQPTRMASAFVDKEGESVDNTLLAPLEKRRDIVHLENANAGDGCRYYEQFLLPHGLWVKLGDCVYIKADELDKPLICRIDKMWTDQNGEGFIHGPYYIFPSEVEHQPTRLFYIREVFKSSIEDTNLMSSISGRCVVMPYKDYVACRITEVPEEHVYVCESKYIEAEKQIKKFMKPTSMIRNNNLSINVCDDEVYFFKKSIVPKKITFAEIRHFETRDEFIKKKEPSPLLLRASTFANTIDEPIDLDETSQMSGQTDVTGFDGSILENSNISATPSSSRKKAQGKNKNKVRPASGYILYAAEFRKTIQQQHSDMGFGEISRIVGQRGTKRRGGSGTTGYIVYAGEFRKNIQKENPEMSFGEVSRLVGQMWRDLPKHEKAQYEERAKKIADEQAAKQEEADRAFNLSLQKFPPAASPGPEARPGTPGQFGTPQGTQQGFSGQQQVPGQGQQGQHYYVHQQINGFTGLPSPGIHPPLQHGVRFAPGQPQPPFPYPPGFHFAQGQPHMGPPPPPPRPASPMFVAVPPRTQRLLHSEAYLRYIENLRPESTSVSNWEKQLTATQDNTPAPANNKLPVHWLANGAGHHETTTAALWALRDLMLRDTLNVSRVLDYAEL